MIAKSYNMCVCVLVIWDIDRCEECRAEASMKKENREKEGNTGLMGAWSHAQYAGERERVWERENRKSSITKL